MVVSGSFLEQELELGIKVRSKFLFVLHVKSLMKGKEAQNRVICLGFNTVDIVSMG